MEVPKTGQRLSIEILVGNGVSNLILNPNKPDEICYTLSQQALKILAERMLKLSEEEQDFDVMSFDLYANELPPVDEEGLNETL